MAHKGRPPLSGSCLDEIRARNSSLVLFFIATNNLCYIVLIEHLSLWSDFQLTLTNPTLYCSFFALVVIMCSPLTSLSTLPCEPDNGSFYPDSPKSPLVLTPRGCHPPGHLSWCCVKQQQPAAKPKGHSSAHHSHHPLCLEVWPYGCAVSPAPWP